jgi:hypothetical protein
LGGRAEDGKDGKTRTDRKKKSKVRSMCKGVCYKEPVLTEEDKNWRPDDDDDSFGGRADMVGGRPVVLVCWAP